LQFVAIRTTHKNVAMLHSLTGGHGCEQGADDKEPSSRTSTVPAHHRDTWIPVSAAGLHRSESGAQAASGPLCKHPHPVANIRHQTLVKWQWKKHVLTCSHIGCSERRLIAAFQVLVGLTSCEMTSRLPTGLLHQCGRNREEKTSSGPRKQNRRS
jgi:hypothetical protein